MTRYRLDLRALPGPVPPEVRLRGLLKTALRGYRLRCTAVEQVDRTDMSASTPDAPALRGTPARGIRREKARGPYSEGCARE
jgi:hypothetical protein